MSVFQSQSRYVKKFYRSHKLVRPPFNFGGIESPFHGVQITDDCVACGSCMDKCSFKAIYQEGEEYRIDYSRLDVCGDCDTVYPTDAIEVAAFDG